MSLIISRLSYNTKITIITNQTVRLDIEHLDLDLWIQNTGTALPFNFNPPKIIMVGFDLRWHLLYLNFIIKVYDHITYSVYVYRWINGWIDGCIYK